MHRKSFLKSLACALIAIPMARMLGADAIPVRIKEPIVETFNYEKYLAEMLERNRDLINELEAKWDDPYDPFYDGAFENDSCSSQRRFVCMHAD